MIKLIKKYWDIVLYLLFGVCTTLINIATYYVFAHIFNCSTVVSSIVAWIIAVIFAYLTNRKWVFHSEEKAKKKIILEMISFFTCRLGTGVVDLIIMYLFVDVFHFNDMVIKVISNIIVIILNYIASKFLVFNKKNKEENGKK